MAEYISRDAVIQSNNTCEKDCASCDFAIDGDSWCQGEIFVVDVLRIPAADVAPVVHSRWELHGDGSGTCQHCHRTQTAVWDFDGWQRFCGDCGAKMDLEEQP